MLVPENNKALQEIVLQGFIITNSGDAGSRTRVRNAETTNIYMLIQRLKSYMELCRLTQRLHARPEKSRALSSGQ